MAEYPGAIDYFVAESRVFSGQNSQQAIVLHCTGSPNPNQTAQQLGDYFASTSLVTSVHYGIDRAGTCCQYVLEADGAGGNCCLEPGYDPFWDQFPEQNKNLCTLSIEFENDITNSLPLTAAQVAVGFPLVRYLMNKYNIPLTNVKGHFSLEPTDRAECPGPAFPWTALTAYLQGGLMIIPAKWNYNPTKKVLTATNGLTVGQGNAQFILLSPDWNPKNVPLAEEYGVPGGTEQPFMTCMLAWNATDGVHYAPLGQRYQAAETQVAGLQTQVTALQKEVAAIPVSITQLANQVAAVLLQLQQYNKLIATDIAAAQAVLQAITPSSS